MQGTESDNRGLANTKAYLIAFLREVRKLSQAEFQALEDELRVQQGAGGAQVEPPTPQAAKHRYRYPCKQCQDHKIKVSIIDSTQSHH